MDFASSAEWSEVSDHEGPVAVCINGEWIKLREHEMSDTIVNGDYMDDMPASSAEVLDDLLGDMPAGKKRTAKAAVKKIVKIVKNAKPDRDAGKPKKKKGGGPRTRLPIFPDTAVIRIIKVRKVRPDAEAARTWNLVKDGMTVKKFKLAVEKAGTGKPPNKSLHWLVKAGNIKVK